MPKMEHKHHWRETAQVTNMLQVENEGLCTIQEGGNKDGFAYLNFRGENGANDSARTLFDSLPKELLALDRQLSQSLLTVASLEMMLPRQVKHSTALRLTSLMLI